MKKVVIGCLGVFLVLAIGGTVVGYMFVIKPGMEMANEFVQVGKEFEQANDRVENQSNFTAPADLMMSQDRFDRYLATQQQIRTRMTDRIKQLDEKYQAFDDAQAGGDRPGIGDVFGAYADLGGVLIELKRAQVDAINAQNFSLEEYNWTRNQVYAAIGQNVGLIAIGGEFSLEQVVGDQSESEPRPKVPQSTIDMVEPHQEQLMEMLALAWFGL